VDRNWDQRDPRTREARLEGMRVRGSESRRLEDTGVRGGEGADTGEKQGGDRVTKEQKVEEEQGLTAIGQ
jgi:hypothetical protein